MRLGARALVVALAAVTLTACAVMGDLIHGPRDRIVFSHKEHLKAGAKPTLEECAACHYQTPKDIRGEEPRLPSEASCLACHGDWKAKNECQRCHTAPDAARTWAPDRLATTIKYSHARHQERIARLEDKPCAYCHETVYGEEKDTAGVRLDASDVDRWHQRCFSCHLMRTEWDNMNCAKCHEKLSDRDGPKPASRFHHGVGWLDKHGDEITSRPGGLTVCSRCHDRAYCNDCHDARADRRVRPEIVWPDRPDRQFIHRGDYVNRHAIEARVEPATCTRCHGTPFCLSCHEQRGLTPPTRQEVQRSDRIDPAQRQIAAYHKGTYDQLIDPASPFFHGRTARRDAALCASCHDQGGRTSCLDCHAVGNTNRPQKTTGGNPHPAGFHSPISKSSRSCRGCHLPGG